MKLLWKRITGKTEELHLPEVNFIGEQDGEPEREFKGRVIPHLSNRKEVNSAYLSQVSYGDDPQIHVALCISNGRKENQRLREDIGTEFSQMFGSHEHLDIFFLTEEKERAIQQVCRSFYESPKSQPSESGNGIRRATS